MTDRPSIDYSNMGEDQKAVEERNQELLDPRGASLKQFNETEIERAHKLITDFGDEGTKQFLRGSEFGNDPTFIGAILEAERQVQVEEQRRTETTMGRRASQLYKNSMDMELEAKRWRSSRLQELIRDSIFHAKNQWIKKHGRPIESGKHPLDNV